MTKNGLRFHCGQPTDESKVNHQVGIGAVIALIMWQTEAANGKATENGFGVD
jgi:hypothetical protein